MRQLNSVEGQESDATLQPQMLCCEYYQGLLKRLFSFFVVQDGAKRGKMPFRGQLDPNMIPIQPTLRTWGKPCILNVCLLHVVLVSYLFMLRMTLGAPR